MINFSTLKSSNWLKKASSLVRAHRKISIVIAVFLAVGGYLSYGTLFKATALNRYILTEVKRTGISTVVSGSGQIAAETQLDLKSKINGTLTYIGIKPGQVVTKGQHILTADPEEANKSLRDAALALSSAETDLQNAKADYEDTKTSENLSLKNQLITLNSTVLPQADKDNVYTSNMNVSGSYNSEEQGRYTVGFYPCNGGVCITYTGLESGSDIVKTNISIPLGTKGLYVSFSTLPAVGDKWIIDLPSPSAPGYLSNLKAYNEKVESVRQAISNAERNVKSKELALEQKQNTYKDATTGQGDYYITAPFSGSVAAVPVQYGESISPSTVLATIVTKQKVAKISLNEVDAAKVKVGDKTKLTFDAIPDLTLDGTVSEMETVGTETQGVVTYGIKIVLDTQDERVLPGMSVASDIVALSKEGVLSVPTAAIKTFRGESYVQVPDASNKITTVAGVLEYSSGTSPKMIPVVTGLSSDRDTEIVSGLEVGDKIVVRTISASATGAKATTPAANTFFGGGTRTGGGTRIPTTTRN